MIFQQRVQTYGPTGEARKSAGQRSVLVPKWLGRSMALPRLQTQATPMCKLKQASSPCMHTS